MSIRVRAVLGNSQWLDGGAMFGNAPRSVWSTWLPPDVEGRIELACRCMLVEIDGKRILCETGIGAFFEPKMAQRFGVRESEHQLVKNLYELGISPDEIDVVILSHLHFDHAGGLLPAYSATRQGDLGELVFSKARYIVGAEALQRAESPHPRDRASFIGGLTDKLRSTRRLTIVDTPASGSGHSYVTDFFPSHFEFEFSHGHTPGHMHTLVAGEKSNVIFAGDLVPGTAWVHVPITMGYDRFPELVIDEKQKFYKDILARDGWVFFTHDLNTSAAKLCEEKGRFSVTDLKGDDLDLTL